METCTYCVSIAVDSCVSVSVTYEFCRWKEELRYRETTLQMWMWVWLLHNMYKLLLLLNYKKQSHDSYHLKFVALSFILWYSMYHSITVIYTYILIISMTKYHIRYSITQMQCHKCSRFLFELWVELANVSSPLTQRNCYVTRGSKQKWYYSAIFFIKGFISNSCWILEIQQIAVTLVFLILKDSVFTRDVYKR